MSENKKVKKMILKFLATESNELLLTEMVKSIDGQFFFFLRSWGKSILNIEIQVKISNKQLVI